MNTAQEVATTIKKLAKTKGINLGKMLTECEMSKNALSTMSARGYLPRAENIVKIADYLGCSVDYLLGRTDVIGVNFASDGDLDKYKEFIEIYSKLSENEKTEWLGRIKQYAEDRQTQKEKAPTYAEQLETIITGSGKIAAEGGDVTGAYGSKKTKTTL